MGDAGRIKYVYQISSPILLNTMHILAYDERKYILAWPEIDPGVFCGCQYSDFFMFLEIRL